MPGMYLKEPRLTYSTCGPFTKNKKEYKNLMKQGIYDIFVQKNQIKLAFNMTWLMEILEDYLTVSNKIIRNKSFNIAKNITYDGYQRGITSTVYIFF